MPTTVEQIRAWTGSIKVSHPEAAAAGAKHLGPIVSNIVASLAELITPGQTTEAIASAVEAGCKEHECLPFLLGHRDFPAAIAISLNDEVVAGIPGPRVLHPGDLVKLELSVISPAGFGQQSWTFCCGAPRQADQVLLDTGPRALQVALATIKTGSRVGDIGAAIQGTVEGAGLTVVRDYVGYGMGNERIQRPQIKGHGKAGFGERLREGNIVNVHVIFKHGTDEVEVSPNEWTAVAVDGQRGAVFSCMAEVTEHGPQLLTAFLS